MPLLKVKYFDGTKMVIDVPYYQLVFKNDLVKMNGHLIPEIVKSTMYNCSSEQFSIKVFYYYEKIGKGVPYRIYTTKPRRSKQPIK